MPLTLHRRSMTVCCRFNRQIEPSHRDVLRRTKKTMQPCLIHLDVISLVAQLTTLTFPQKPPLVGPSATALSSRPPMAAGECRCGALVAAATAVEGCAAACEADARFKVPPRSPKSTLVNTC